MKKARKRIETLDEHEDAKQWALDVITRLMEDRIMEVRARKLVNDEQINGNTNLMVCKDGDTQFLLSNIMGRQPKNMEADYFEDYPYLLRVKQHAGARGKTRYKILEVLEEAPGIRYKKAA